MSSDDASGRTPDRTDLVEAAVLAVEGVTALHAGVLGEVATYLPGRRVNGIKLDGDDAELHVVLAPGHPVVATADQVREAVRHLLPGRVDVTVEDVAPPS